MIRIDDLIDRADALVDTLSRPVDGRDGLDGKDGRDGKDADPELVAELVRQAVADMPRPRDGTDGLDADPELIRAEVERSVGALTLRAGDRGPQGPAGDLGPMPAHEWQGTRLRFEVESGKWGPFVDLRGPRGAGGGGGSVIGSATRSSFSYMPGGW